MQLAAQQARADKAEALLKQVGETPPAGTHGERLPRVSVCELLHRPARRARSCRNDACKPVSV